VSEQALPLMLPPQARSIRSFVRRTGRTTAGQAKAFESIGPLALISYAAAAIDLGAVFGRPAPTILEIGFGMGEATAQIAALLPEKNFLCCEVHTPGVGALLKRIEEQSLSNIRIIQHDAVEVLEHMLLPASLDGIHIFFPDPWHKKKHNNSSPAGGPVGIAFKARCLPSLRHRLAAVCKPNFGSPERAATAQKHRLRLRPQARLPAPDQVRKPGHQARPRGVGCGV
jgi:Putative methyltransferase